VNVCGVIITTNHKTDGVYLPADDRRHYVAWSDCQKTDFGPDYFPDIYKWYESGGYDNVAAYLRQYDISKFDPKAPPPKTPAFWAIVSANRVPEDAELADALDRLVNPKAVTLAAIIAVCGKDKNDFEEWLRDRRNNRKIQHRMESCGYVGIDNPDAQDHLWRIGGRRQVIYVRKELNSREQMVAAQRLLGRRQ